jgi:RNA polymerase sigma-70 factor (ECF subfamily)
MVLTGKTYYNMKRNMRDNEAQMIRSCLAGNRETFEILVNRYESHVKALAWNIIGNPEEAMEISQETFLQAFKNLHLFDMSKNFKSWLLGITIKRSIDKLRKQKSFLNFFQRYSLEVPLTNEEIKPIDESPIFQFLMNRLKERERIALSLQINENYTAKEIGKILDCSENSVRVLLFKAKKKLKKVLLANETKGKTNKNPGVSL